MPTQNVPKPITPAPNRDTAATLVADISGLSPLTAGLVVDLVDVGTSAMLAFLGLDPLDVRRVAVAIWTGRPGLDGAEANGEVGP